MTTISCGTILNTVIVWQYRCSLDFEECFTLNWKTFPLKEVFFTIYFGQLLYSCMIGIMLEPITTIACLLISRVCQYSNGEYSWQVSDNGFNTVYSATSHQIVGSASQGYISLPCKQIRRWEGSCSLVCWWANYFLFFFLSPCFV